MDAKMSTWRPGTAVCRCCLAEGCYKDISTEYFWMGKREVYAEMLTETFDLAISYSQSGGPNSNSRLICEPCISRLRDASEFKRQVYDCEKMFMQHLEPTGSGIVSTEVEIEPLNKDVKVEAVKEEKEDSGDDFFDDRNDFGDDDDDDDLDDEPLTKLATKVPKKEKKVDLLDFLEKPAVAKPAAEKRKAPAPPKPKATPVKKVKVVKEAKPSASKDKVVEKKKKGLAQDVGLGKMRDSARLILKHSTAYPFKLAKNEHIQCYFCPKNFEDPVEFRRHFDCLHCGVDRSSVFSDNMSTRIDITNLLCRLCATLHDSLPSLAEHLQSQHSISVDPTIKVNLLPLKMEKDATICATCGTTFTSQKELSKHLYVHSLGLICHICGKKFQTKRGLQGHMTEKHSTTFTCRQCRRQFATKPERIQHIRENKSCWPYGCATCKERFHFWEARQSHLELVHGEKKITFPCKECGLVFEKRIQLYFHFKQTHTQDLKCHICGLTFSQKRDLLEHGYTHTGERPYKCSHCDASFAKSKTYATHIKSHDDSKKLGCPVCSKLFVGRAKIRLHVSKHHPDIFEQWAVSMKYKF